MTLSVLAIDSLPYYDEASIVFGFLTLFIVVIGIYKFVPDFAPKTWKSFGAHALVALLLSTAILVLPNEVLDFGERALQASLALVAITLGQGLTFTDQRSFLRKEHSVQSE